MMSYLNRNGAGTATANVSVAVPYEDYEPVSQVVRLAPGETSKKIALNSTSQFNLGSNQFRVYTVQFKPLLGNSSLNLCGLINPDYVNVVIQGDKATKSNTFIYFIYLNHNIKKSFDYNKINLYRLILRRRDRNMYLSCFNFDSPVLNFANIE